MFRQECIFTVKPTSKVRVKVKELIADIIRTSLLVLKIVGHQTPVDTKLIHSQLMDSDIDSKGRMGITDSQKFSPI